MTFALKVEKDGYQALLDLHEVADKHGDFDVRMCVSVGCSFVLNDLLEVGILEA